MASSSSFSGFTLSSIRTHRGAEQSASLASAPATAPKAGPGATVAPSSRVDGHTRFSSSRMHPYFAEDATRTPAAPHTNTGIIATAHKESTHAVEVPSASLAEKSAMAKPNSRQVSTATSQTQKPQRRTASTGPDSRNRRTATSSAPATTQYETALSSFQRTIIAEARAERQARTREKAIKLAHRAAVMEHYSSKPPQRSAWVNAEGAGQATTRRKAVAAPRPPWLGDGVITHPLAPPSQSASSVTRRPVAQLSPPRELIEVNMSVQAGPSAAASGPSPRDRAEPPLVTQQPSESRENSAPLSDAVPPPLPRAPAALPASAPSVTSRAASPSAEATRQPARHPALHESLALLREVETHYPLLRRLLTPPRRPHTVTQLQSTGSASARVDHDVPSLASCYRDQCTPQPPQSPPPASLDTASHLGHHERAQSSQEQERGEASTGSWRSPTLDSEPPWLAGVPGSLRHLFDRARQPRPVPLYHWSASEARAAACMHGAFVTPHEDFSRAVERAQWRHQMQRAQPSCWAASGGSTHCTSVSHAEEDARTANVRPIHDERLRGLLDEYFACTRVAATTAAPLHTPTTASSSFTASAPTLTESPARHWDDGREDADTLAVANGPMEARTLEALLSFTTALSTSPKPLPRTAGDASGWLDTLDAATPSPVS